MNPKQINVEEIVLKYLKKNGFDGLFNPNLDCGCEKDDLFACCLGDNTVECIPGYKCNQKCDECHWENCEVRNESWAILEDPEEMQSGK